MLKLENDYKRAYQCAYGSLFFEKNNDCKHFSAYGLRSRDRSMNNKKYSIIKVHHKGFYKLDQICLENCACLSFFSRIIRYIIPLKLRVSI